MKKYLTIALLLTVLFIPFSQLSAQVMGDNDNNPINDNIDNNDNNDNLNDNNNINNNNNNTPNNNNRPNNNINDNLNDDDNDFLNYINVGVSGIALGSLITYFIVKRDY